jgi:hypothetical protein
VRWRERPSKLIEWRPVRAGIIDTCFASSIGIGRSTESSRPVIRPTRPLAALFENDPGTPDGFYWIETTNEDGDSS